ncbi:hypothetical protein ACKVWM_005713 [Pyricularia oryzae]
MARNQQQEDDWASYMGKKTYGFEASNLNRQKMTEVGDFQVASIPDSIERMLPAVVVNDPETGWMQEDEAEIQASWDASSIRREMDSLDNRTAGPLSIAWNMSTRILGCLPTDVIGPRSGMRAAGKQLVWAPAFARAFCIAIPGLLWEEGHPDILVLVLQYIVINRTNDRRKWKMPVPTSSDCFFRLLAEGMANKADGQSVAEVHKLVREAHPEIGYSPFSALFSRIEDRVGRENAAEVVPEEQEIQAAYEVTEADLRIAGEMAAGRSGNYAAPASLRCHTLVAAFSDQPLEHLAWYLEVVGKDILRCQAMIAKGFDVRNLIQDRKVTADVTPTAGANPGGRPKKRKRGPRSNAPEQEQQGDEDEDEDQPLARRGPGRPRGSKTRKMASDTPVERPQRRLAVRASRTVRTVPTREVIVPTRPGQVASIRGAGTEEAAESTVDEPEAAAEDDAGGDDEQDLLDFPADKPVDSQPARVPIVTAEQSWTMWRSVVGVSPVVIRAGVSL